MSTTLPSHSVFVAKSEHSAAFVVVIEAATRRKERHEKYRERIVVGRSEWQGRSTSEPFKFVSNYDCSTDNLRGFWARSRSQGAVRALSRIELGVSAVFVQIFGMLLDWSSERAVDAFPTAGR